MKKIPVILTSLALGTLLATSTPLSAIAAATTRDYNYARQGDLGFTSVCAADVLASYLGAPLDDVERNYLAAHTSFSLTYSDSIGLSYVTASFSEGENADMGTLSVAADAYSYRAANGEEVVWAPTGVSAGGRAFHAEDGVWTGDILGPEDGDYATVTYQTNLSVAAEDVNAFLNTTYEEAEHVYEKLEKARRDYEADCARYERASEAYGMYLRSLADYENKLAAYNAYVAAYNEWKRKYDVYASYKEECDRYLAEQAVYEEYLAARAAYDAARQRYQQYQSDLKAYEEKCKQYEAATAFDDAQLVLWQLSVLKYMTTPVTALKRSLSGAILGNAVTEVLANTEALVLAGAERSVVNLANSATVNLRRLINRYNACTDDFGRYMYYTACHAELSKNFNDLLRCLDYFYHGFVVVRNELRKRDRTEQFEILLAQLYFMCNALDDGVIGNYYMMNGGGSKAANFDSAYRIGATTKRTPAEVLGEEGVLEDRNQANRETENGYPTLPEKPVPPAVVADPGAAPKEVKKPTMPEPAVADPGHAPDVVLKPELPDEVPEPALPVPYEPTESELAFETAYLGGALQKRSLLTSDYALPVFTAVTRYFRNAQEVLVRFHDGGSVYEVVAEKGTYVDYPYVYPTKSRTGYTCTFDHWVDEAGERVDLNRLTAGDSGKLDLYPHFSETPNLYNVVWIVDGARVSDKCAFDCSPVYDSARLGELKKPSADAHRLCRFVGWATVRNATAPTYPVGTDLPTMSESTAYYYAVFEESFVVTWKVADRTGFTPAWKGDVPCYGGELVQLPNDYYRFAFAGWDKEIVVVTEDVTYTAVFLGEPLVKAGETVVSARYRSDEGRYDVDCSGMEAGSVELGPLLELAAQNSAAVTLRFADSTAVISSHAVYNAAQSGLQALDFSVACTRAQTYLFSVQYRFADGETENDRTVSEDIPFVFTVSGEFDPVNSYFTSTDEAGNVAEVRFTVTETELSFTMRHGLVYEISPQFAVTVFPSEHVEISVKGARARVGETVEVTLTAPPPGMFVSLVYVLFDDGTELHLADGTFEMPAQAVGIGVLCDYHVYTVVFKSEGKTVLTQTYLYGDEIVSPSSDPVKADDETYQYAFVGWDREFGTVTGDAEFNAVFRAEPLEVEEIPDTRLNKIIRAFYKLIPVGIAYVCVCFLTAVIAGVVEHRRRKRERAQAAVNVDRNREKDRTESFENSDEERD